MRVSRSFARAVSLLWIPALTLNVAAATLDRVDLKRSLDPLTISVKNRVIATQLSATSPDWRLAIAELEDGRIDAATKEFLLGSFLVQVRSRVPDQVVRTYVSELVDHRSQTFVWHEEGPLPVEAYPIAQLALGTLRIWDTVAAKLSAAQAFQHGTYGALNYLRLPGTVEYAGTLQALQSADFLQITAAKDWLYEYATVIEAFEAFSIVALRSGDESLTRTLLNIDGGAASLRLLRDIRDHFTGEQAFELFRGSIGNSMLASAAVAELDKLRDTLSNQRVDNFLLQLLADPVAGSSAAFVLARRKDEQVMTKVAAVLRDAGSSARLQARVVLALTLANTNSSRAALQRASSAGSALDEALRLEVLKWLAH